MKVLAWAALVATGVFGCGGQDEPSPSAAPRAESFAEARQNFQTELTRKEALNAHVPEPPPELFRLVRYDSPAGKLAAYVSPDPGDGKKRPAMIWIFGGFSNSISETAWEPAEPDNDQSASAFREAGILMMYPSLRGGNDNPGYMEGFCGEVDDVLAAADYLATLDYVDRDRIYLGGHSTGGTLVLLCAAATPRFRGVFSFGPVDDIRGYGEEELPVDLGKLQEWKFRSPGEWLHSIKSPVFVFEGTVDGNLFSLRNMSRGSTNPMVHFHEVSGADHFSILRPVSELIAGKILADGDPRSNITFIETELLRAVSR